MPVKVFGVPLDPLDAPERVELKRAYLAARAAGRTPRPDYLDPYGALTSMYRGLLDRHGCTMLGNLPVEGFLAPKPAYADAPQVTAADLGAFLHTGGCLEYARAVRDFIRGSVLPDPFLMLGVDHSATGGALEALSGENGELSLVVLDSHYDGIGLREMAGLSEYCLEAAPRLAEEMGASARACAAARAVAGRSYTCGDFLARAFEDGWADPRRSFVLGVADYPRPELRSSADPRARAYVEAYERFQRLGLTVVTREALKREPAASAAGVARAIGGRPLYVSVDLDVASDPRGVFGVRFASPPGMGARAPAALLRHIRAHLEAADASPVGADLMELDVHLAGRSAPGLPPDRTYRAAGGILEALLGLLARGEADRPAPARDPGGQHRPKYLPQF